MAGGFPLVGRDQELAWLHERVAQAAAGNGGLVVLEGEAGVGKSALAARLLLEAGVPGVAVGRCPGPGETPPFGPWLELFALLPPVGAGPDLPLTPGEADSEQDIRKLALDAFAWLSHHDRTLLLLEDIHWADPASLEVLRHFTPLLARSRLLVVVTSRSDEVTRQHPLWTLLPQLQRSGAHRLHLERLSRASVQQLLGTVGTELGPGAAALLQDLYERTGGHPLFLFELLAAVRRLGQGALAQLPDSLLQAIDLKLQRLSEPARSLLNVAAVIGERFEYDLLATAAGLSDSSLADLLEEALALRLLRLDGEHDHFAFDHALVREAILSQLIAPRRRRWHTAVAEVLLTRSTPDVALLALHLRLAGDSRAVQWLAAAGDRALRLGALAQAKQHYEQAAALLAGGDERRPRLLVKLGYALAYHDPATASTLWQEALRTAAGDPAVSAWAQYLLLRDQLRRGESGEPEGLAQLEAQQALLLTDVDYLRLETELFGHQCGYPRIAGERAATLAARGRHQEMDHILAAARATAPSREAMADVIYAEATSAILAGDYDRALEVMRQVRELRLQLRQYRLAAAVQFNLLTALLLYRSERVAEIDAAASQLLTDEQTALEKAGEGTTRPDFSPLGVYQFYRGDWAAARRNLIERHQHPPADERPLLRVYGADLARSSGDPHRALSLLASIRPLTPNQEQLARTIVLTIPLTRVEAYLDLGEVGTADEWLAACQRWVDQYQARPWTGLTSIIRSRLLMQTGDLPAALAEARKGQQCVDQYGLTTWRIKGYRQTGEIAMALADRGLAQSCLSQALALAEACRFPYEAALCHLGLGRAAAHAATARSHLVTARDSLAGLGAAPALAAATRALDQLSESQSPAPHVSVAALTEREQQIVQLVARGCTDMEIGAQLFISRRTVDRHLRNIGDKLAISGRGALGAYAARHGLVD